MGIFSNPLKKHKKIAQNTLAGKIGSKSIVGRQLNSGGNSPAQPAQRSGAKPMQVQPPGTRIAPSTPAQRYGSAPGGGMGGAMDPAMGAGARRAVDMGAPRRAEGGMVGKTKAAKSAKGCSHKGKK